MVKIEVYGIPNCNSVKKARDWLEARGIAYTFIDFKKTPPTAQLLENWLKQQPLDSLLNRKGTTWKQLSDLEKESTSNQANAIALMMSKSSLIKRPVISQGKQILLGFDSDLYQEKLVISS